MAKEYIGRSDALALETFLQDADGFEHSCVLSVDIRSCPAADVVEVVHDKKRKQIAERLKDYHDRNTPGDYKTSIFGVAALLLEQDASAERQGHWIGLEYDGYADGCPVYDLWECSECGEEVSGEDVPETHLFCHGCGARMDGE